MMEPAAILEEMPLEQPAIDPYPLEKISKDNAGLMNTIFRHSRCQVTDPELGSLKIQFFPGLSDYSRETGISLKLTTGSGKCCLGMEHFIFNDIMDRFHTSHTVPDLPPTIRLLLLEAVFDDLFHRIESHSGQKCTIEKADFGRGITDPACRHHLYFTLSSHQESPAGSDNAIRNTRGHLDLDDSSLRMLASFIKGFGQSGNPKKCWDFIPITAVYEMGYARMPAAMIARARPLDIILLEQCFSQNNNRIRVKLSDGQIFAARMDMENNSIMLTEKGDIMMSDLHNESITYNDDLEPHDSGQDETGSGPEYYQDLEQGQDREDPGEPGSRDEADIIDARSIPVKLTFELGQKEFSLGELKNIGPGYHIQLDQEVDKPVMIRTGRKVIGTGQMLQIGDRIGIRVLGILDKLFEEGE